jgi:hypothetical protein
MEKAPGRIAPIGSKLHPAAGARGLGKFKPALGASHIQIPRDEVFPF